MAKNESGSVGEEGGRGGATCVTVRGEIEKREPSMWKQGRRRLVSHKGNR